MGPNEGKSFLEQIRCVARALMAYSPQTFENKLALEEKFSEYIVQHGQPQNVWIRCILPDRDWYVFHGDPVNGGGKSGPSLPDGAQIKATLDIRSSEKKTLTAFEKAVTYLESGSVPNSFLDIAHETMKSPMLSAIAMAPLNYYKEQIKNLKKTVEGCKPEYNINKIDEFRNWLRKFPDTHARDPEKPARSVLIVNNPDRLKAFVGHLQEERRRYCVDALLYGSIQTIFDICGLCATEAQKKSSDNTTFAKVFSNLALFLTNDKKKEPLQLLGGTIQKAINNGFINELLTLVEKYQSMVSGRIKEARSSKTVDQSLDHLYSAIPFAFGARSVLFILRDNADLLNEDTKLLVKGSYEMIDETLTRLTARPFVVQTLDFKGAEWKARKAYVAEIRRTRGEKSAEIYVKDMIRRHLIYPESFIPKLLDQNNQNT
jgi:hypothetical protein